MIICIALHSPKIHKLVVLLAVVFVMVVTQKQINMQMNNYANNQMDRQQIDWVMSTIRSYEDYHGLRIRRIYYLYDSPDVIFRQSLSNYWDLTISILQVRWMPYPIFYIHFGRDVVVSSMYRYMHADEIARISYERGRHWFTNGYMVFEGDTLFIFIGAP